MRHANVKSEARHPYVAGVGASAGGLEALLSMFNGMRRTGEMAFVIVQHLSPDFSDIMDQLLIPRTPLEVVRAEEGMPVEADRIYLRPVRNEMIISGGRLHLTDRDHRHGVPLPIDSFLRSLAEDAGARAIAVVLSGTGRDGARGVRSVHDAGGLVIAQTEGSAKFGDMPRNAIDTGMVDLVLPPEAIADHLVRYVEEGAPAAPPR